jgi:prefoldin subunit 5
MRNAAEQAKIYENSLTLLNKTIKKNELTMKQLEKMGGNRSIYVPLGRAYQFTYFSFLRKDKDSTIKEFTGANEKLIESSKEMESKIKLLTEKANEKYKILREGTDRLTKK